MKVSEGGNPHPVRVLIKVLNGLAVRNQELHSSCFKVDGWAVLSRSYTFLDLFERVVEREVQNVKRSSFLLTSRPRNCSHNPPRAPTART